MSSLPPRDWIEDAGRALLARWWWLAAGGIVGLLIAAAYLRAADYRYTATLRVAPAPAAGREPGGSGTLGSLAALAGVTVDAVPATPFRLYVEGITSHAVASRLAADRGLMRAIFAREWNGRGWFDPDVGAFRIEPLAGAPMPAWRPPGADRLHQWLGRRVFIGQDVRTPIVTVAIDAESPALAARLLARLHATTDALIRERATARAAANIRWLGSRLPQITEADQRQSLYATLLDQEQRLMLARNPSAFAAESFGAITVPPQPTSPRQIPLLAAGLVVGALLAAALALLVRRR
jgi:uncharacterized protein involved in exopolysaccharide biosynthesis